MGKNPRAKRPASEMDSALFKGGTTPAPEVRVPDAEPSRVLGDSKAGNDKSKTDGPRLVHRKGVAYLEGCDVPVWRLEMARRAGSGPAALTASFPGLTSPGLDLAFAHARRHREKFDALIRQEGAAAVPAGDEGADGAAAFEADLEALLDKNAEVFRRLAL
ncbi:MAG: hypothetical protein ACHRXM_23880 [Isosphaerales bacterium]